MKPIKFKFTVLDKRQKFVIHTLLLTAGLFLTQIIWEDYRFIMVVILSILSYILTYWSLSEKIKGIEWLLLFILPLYFTASISLFYFLLPARVFIRLTIAVIFALGTYAILLIENIYNVAIDRSIQLLRVAHVIGLLITLVVIFLSSNILYSFRLPFWLNTIIIGIFVYFLALQSLWSITLETKISGKILKYGGVVSLLMGEATLVLSFWPMTNASYSLFMATCFYVLVGLFQHNLQERLFMKTVREYIFVFVIISLLMFISTKWGG